MHTDIIARINEAAQNCFGVLTALYAARSQVGDKNLILFLDRVPEKGDALWTRFRGFQQERGDQMHFGHFIASVVMPIPFGK